MPCLNPFVDTTGEKFPCGQCPECGKRRISEWHFRLVQQFKIATSAQFITLTYADHRIPITRNKMNTLCKGDVQLFFKRLRQKNLDKKIKYYLCGEYGGNTHRPHYHIILFDCDIETIQPSWIYGNVHYGSVTEASIGYTLKYLSKPRTAGYDRDDDRQREFSLMSKGLGLNISAAR